MRSVMNSLDMSDIRMLSRGGPVAEVALGPLLFNAPIKVQCSCLVQCPNRSPPPTPHKTDQLVVHPQKKGICIDFLCPKGRGRLESSSMDIFLSPPRFSSPLCFQFKLT